MDIVDITEKSIKIAIEYNEVIDYLEGSEIYKIRSDPRDISSPHAYGFSIECYNKYAAKNPDLALGQLFEDEIIKRLNDEKCNIFDIYGIFNCLVAQFRLEKSNKAAFRLDESKLLLILKLLKQKIFEFQERLSECKLEKGEDYEDGMFGYIMKVNKEVGLLSIT